MYPVHLAAKKGSTDVCMVLLRKQANAAATNTEGMTPLHVAAKNMHANCCVLFLEKYKQLVNKRDNAGKTPLHYIVESSKLAIPPEETSSKDNTQARKVAAAVECCKVLLTGRTDVWIQDNDKHSAVWYAFEHKIDKMFGLLLNHAKDLRKGDIDLRECIAGAIDQKRRFVYKVSRNIRRLSSSQCQQCPTQVQRYR